MKEFFVDKSDRFILSSTSKGNQTKWFLDNYYIKADILGYEGFAEALASELLRYVVSGLRFTDYYLCTAHEGDFDYRGCYSENFLSDGQSLISIMNILENNISDLKHFFSTNTGKELMRGVVDTVGAVTGIDCYSYLDFMLKFDAIILNEDRHLNNISLIYNRDNTFSLAPIFDNGLSLLSDIHDYSLNGSLRKLVRAVKAKPFSVDFFKQCSYFSDKLLEIDYNGFMESLKINESLYCDILEYRRAVNVLLFRLKQTRGILWQEV